MPFDSFKAGGVATDDTKGETPVQDLTSSHVDAVNLDLVRLSSVAGMVAKAIKEGRYRRWSARSVKQALAIAILGNRLALADLSERLRAKVETAVAEEKTKRQAEEKARRQAEEKASREAVEKARHEAEQARLKAKRARKEAAEKDRQETEAERDDQ